MKMKLLCPSVPSNIWRLFDKTTSLVLHIMQQCHPVTQARNLVFILYSSHFYLSLSSTHILMSAPRARPPGLKTFLGHLFLPPDILWCAMSILLGELLKMFQVSYYMLQWLSFAFRNKFKLWAIIHRVLYKYNLTNFFLPFKPLLFCVFLLGSFSGVQVWIMSPSNGLLRHFVIFCYRTEHIVL